MTSQNPKSDIKTQSYKNRLINNVKQDKLVNDLKSLNITESKKSDEVCTDGLSYRVNGDCHSSSSTTSSSSNNQNFNQNTKKSLTEAPTMNGDKPNSIITKPIKTTNPITMNHISNNILNLTQNTTSNFGNRIALKMKLKFLQDSQLDMDERSVVTDCDSNEVSIQDDEEVDVSNKIRDNSNKIETSNDDNDEIEKKSDQAVSFEEEKESITTSESSRESVNTNTIPVNLNTGYTQFSIPTIQPTTYPPTNIYPPDQEKLYYHFLQILTQQQLQNQSLSGLPYTQQPATQYIYPPTGSTKTNGNTSNVTPQSAHPFFHSYIPPTAAQSQAPPTTFIPFFHPAATPGPATQQTTPLFYTPNNAASQYYPGSYLNNARTSSQHQHSNTNNQTNSTTQSQQQQQYYLIYNPYNFLAQPQPHLQPPVPQQHYHQHHTNYNSFIPSSQVPLRLMQNSTTSNTTTSNSNTNSNSNNQNNNNTNNNSNNQNRSDYHYQQYDNYQR